MKIQVEYESDSDFVPLYWSNPIAPKSNQLRIEYVPYDDSRHTHELPSVTHYQPQNQVPEPKKELLYLVKMTNYTITVRTL